MKIINGNKGCLLHPEKRITALAIMQVDEKVKNQFHQLNDIVYGACSDCMKEVDGPNGKHQIDLCEAEILKILKSEAH